MKKHSPALSTSGGHRLLMTLLALLLLYVSCQVTAQDGNGSDNNDDNNTTEASNITTTEAPPGTTCQNDTCGHGTCNDTSGVVVCTCDSGWTGDNCTTDEDECQMGLCQNEAYCENKEGSYECVCTTGWTGTNCDQDVDECSKDPSPCTDPHGRCVNTTGSYSCVCLEGYERLSADGACQEIVIVPYNDSKTKREWGDDQIFGPFFIPGGVNFGGTPVILYYISTNGYITFNTKFSQSTMPDPASSKLTSLYFLAPFWADIDIPEDSTTSGLYHLSLSLADTYNDNETKALFEHYTNLTGLNDFHPIFISVVTWANVLPYKAEDFPNFQPATFQVVMATDGWNMKGKAAWRTIWTQLDDFNVSSYHRLTSGAASSWMPLPDTPGKVDFVVSDNQLTSFAPCVEWLGTQGPKFKDAGSDPVTCPCSLTQAEADPLFAVADNPNGGKCATTRVFNQQTGRKTKCCYGSDGMISLVPVVPELKDSDQNTVVQEGFTACCATSHPIMCGEFTKVFPVHNCSGYTPPESALVWGNGHLRTVDEVEYTYNAWREFVLLRSKGNDQSSEVDDMEIQGRSQEFGQNSDSNTTMFTAFAVKYDNASAFEVHANSGKVKLYVNGQETTATQADLGADIVLLSANADQKLDIFLPSGTSLQVSAWKDRLSLAVSAVDLGTRDDLKGLLMAQSIHEGFESLSPEAKFSEAATWSLSEGDSLFTYNMTGQGDDFASYQHPGFTPTFPPASAEELLSELNKTDKMEAGKTLCGENVACLQDFLVTGDQETAQNTKTTQDDFRQMQETLEKKPPQFDMADPVMNVTIADEMFVQTVRVRPEVTNASHYPDVTVSVTKAPDSVSLNYTFEAGAEDGQWTLTWYLDQEVRTLTSLTFTFVATSSVTALTSRHVPAVVLCGCEQKSQCDYFTVDQQVAALASQSAGLYVADCQCNDTKGGRFCQDDVNVCDACYNANLCNVTLDTPCQCPDGYEGNGVKCYEKNECLQADTCEQLCENSVGSYNCSCHPGYLLKDERRCEDEDECLTDSHNCSSTQFCENTPGSFLCYCRHDFGGDQCTEKG